MFVWGSILVWFVVLPVTSSSTFYVAGIGTFEFNFLGVFYEVLQSATFWFYWPLATIIALGPTIAFRTLLLDFKPTLVDDVRLQMKKEGRKAFRRTLMKTKLPRISLGRVKERTGYAFSHKGGFGKLIMSGRMFSGQSEEQVHREREQRLSTIFQKSSHPLPHAVDDSTIQNAGALNSLSVTVQTQGITTEVPIELVTSSSVEEGTKEVPETLQTVV